MRLSDYIQATKDRLIERWKEIAVSRLALDLEGSDLLNHLPEFVDELVRVAEDPTNELPTMQSARSHGRQRMSVGVDMSTLTLEMALVGELILALAGEDGVEFESEDVQLLSRLIGCAISVSVEAYSEMRDQQLIAQAAQQFSFIAHEIRNPLHSARLAAKAIGASDDAQRQSHLARLERSLTQLNSLVNSSLVRARILRNPEPDLERLSARALVDETCARVADLARSSGQTIACNAEDFELDGDRELLLSALTNLLDNAVKFTHDDGHISLRARREGALAVFEIQDECGGLSVESPDELFQPFVQAEDDSRGFGLGLAIVKRAVEAHGGNVRVINGPGVGCTFALELPVEQ